MNPEYTVSMYYCKILQAKIGPGVQYQKLIILYILP